MRLHKRRRGAMPYGEDVDDDGARHEDLTVRQHVFVRLLSERVDLEDRRAGALALEPERCEREPRARDDLEQVWPGPQHAGEFLGEPDVLADVRLQPADAVHADHEPDFEAPEPPAEGDLPVPIVGHEPAIRVGVLEDGEADAQRLG